MLDLSSIAAALAVIRLYVSDCSFVNSEGGRGVQTGCRGFCRELRRSFCRRSCSRLLARFPVLPFYSAVVCFCRPLFPGDTGSSLVDRFFVLGFVDLDLDWDGDGLCAILLNSG